ncbi:ParB/RepB/Spo0J family partition protein [Allorhizobium taibaishanense]|uniref:Chromosome partitioning protein ParB n=1 Tax=Allorhizobium taibaishanense TaxID=887144 RepID=A0A1Q9A098_9HYPH|nr:ParB/Srx family N-terminal domain-containing protein [Allorhizobium taibaishanense]MBB4010436.1 ParB family chromosome partitioning protein [Allorhizobium taibaishanense]OLP48010.1 chromosome partitioning protein ParB [Allorhizobium taibaishanense]
MARTAKKAKAVTTTTAEDVATDENVISIGDVSADVIAALLAPKSIAAESTSGAEILIPLDRLKKSPRNARKTPHSNETVETYAASIAAKGILQNLVVEPEFGPDGEPTGFYFVTIGEGRRLAQALRAKRKEIAQDEPVRCVIDTGNDPFEISLDENVTRSNLLPADQFEAFRELAEQRGWGAEEIAARFGVTAHVVKQRLRLGAVSPKLMQVYRDGDLNLDQLMAFAVTDDHARQEQVYDGLGYNREAYIIRRELTRTHVQANDRKAIFVGAEAYIEAGGTILRDLFTEDRGGYFEDAVLLDRLVLEKLESIAADLRAAEGWKWTEAFIDYPHAHGLRRVYPQPVDMSAEDLAAREAAQTEFDALTAEWENTDEDLPPDVDQRFKELEAEIERLDAMRHAYDPEAVGCGGAFVSLNYEGAARIERGFIRPEDEKSQPEADGIENGETVIDGVRVNADGEVIADTDGQGGDPAREEDEGDAAQPVSDILTRDLTAHRTLGLRLAVGEQPEIALIAVTHALAAQTFYRGVEANVLEIRPMSAPLSGHADGIEDTAAARMLADRHAGWATDMPRDVADLWDFITGLDQASVMALFAHCASLTVNAVKQPWEQRPRAQRTADRLAAVLALDMSQHWRPTARSYLGRVTKAHILAAVREACGDEAAERIADMKKAPMAEAAEQLLGRTGWLPPLLRTERPAVPTSQADGIADADASHPAFAGDVGPFGAEAWEEGPGHRHADDDGMDDGVGFSEAAE